MALCLTNSQNYKVTPCLCLPATTLSIFALPTSWRPFVGTAATLHASGKTEIATAADAGRLDEVLRHMESRTGLRVLRLPLLEEFHIDLGFDLATGAVPKRGTAARAPGPLDDTDRRLVAAVEGEIGRAHV